MIDAGRPKGLSAQVNKNQRFQEQLLGRVEQRLLREGEATRRSGLAQLPHRDRANAVQLLDLALAEAGKRLERFRSLPQPVPSVLAG